jgi:CTP:molybdopterin cytidylyltransferase MocA
MHRLGVLIAAAGNSARMGSPKALMPIAQRTAIDFATHQFSKILHLDIYVSLPPALLVLDAPLQRDAQRRSPHSLPIYPRLDRGVRAHCAISSTKPWCKPRDQTAGRTVRLINRFSDQGYLGSIKSMLEDHAGNLDGLFITPIDSPPFDERLIIVMAQLARVDHEPRIIVPHTASNTNFRNF